MSKDAYVHTAGSWHKVKEVHNYTNGSWRKDSEGYVYTNGGHKKWWPSVDYAEVDLGSGWEFLPGYPGDASVGASLFSPWTNTSSAVKDSVYVWEQKYGGRIFRYNNGTWTLCTLPNIVNTYPAASSYLMDNIADFDFDGTGASMFQLAYYDNSTDGGRKLILSVGASSPNAFTQTSSFTGNYNGIYKNGFAGLEAHSGSNPTPGNEKTFGYCNWGKNWGILSRIPNTFSLVGQSLQSIYNMVGVQSYENLATTERNGTTIFGAQAAAQFLVGVTSPIEYAASYGFSAAGLTGHITSGLPFGLGYTKGGSGARPSSVYVLDSNGKYYRDAVFIPDPDYPGNVFGTINNVGLTTKRYRTNIPEDSPIVARCRGSDCLWGWYNGNLYRLKPTITMIDPNSPVVVPTTPSIFISAPQVTAPKSELTPGEQMTVSITGSVVSNGGTPTYNIVERTGLDYA